MVTEKHAVLMEVGSELVQATENSASAVVAAAQTIALFVKRRTAAGVPFGAGDADALPALHKALGSSLTALRDLDEARLTSFSLAKTLGFIGDEVGPMCPCAGAAPASLALVRDVAQAA